MSSLADWRIGLLIASVLAFSGGLQAAPSPLAPPNILWHHKGTGETALWVMKGTNVEKVINLPPTADDPSWKAAGIADFNGDGQPDIVWQNEHTGQNALWYMKGTQVLSNALIQAAGDLTWKIVGTADFDNDRKPDLLWTNVRDGANAVWFMDKERLISHTLLPSNEKWKLSAIGDFNRDGKPDIVVRNQETGQNAVWLMEGVSRKSVALFKTPNGTEASERDQDWQIVGAPDLNGDKKPDLLWRHATLGLNVCWFMDNQTTIASTFLGQHEFDTDWRICGQDTADSTWQLKSATSTFLRASLASNPARALLEFNVPPNANFGCTIQRRRWSETNWTTLVTGHPGSRYEDAKIKQGETYEYKIFREGMGGFPVSFSEHVSLAADAPPTEDRGGAVLLVDRTLADELSASLEQLREDLVGDGWRVVRFDVPRQIDEDTSLEASRSNGRAVVDEIKPLIRSALSNDPGLKSVIIVGHVAIPYSGSYTSDGHNCGPPPFGPDHRGAWPADIYYGSMAGVWTDSSVTLTNCDFPEPTNIPGDGKFDQDTLPGSTPLQLAVGRIDFARLSAFTERPPPGLSTRSEAALLRQYLAKNHQYRMKGLSWQNDPGLARAMVFGHFHDSRDYDLVAGAQQAALGLEAKTNALLVSDFCMRRRLPSQWGFLAGPGGFDRVNMGFPVLEHTTAQLAEPANEPSCAFYMVLASYLGDWNLRTNNFLRALLATPQYGLASMWTRHNLWRTDALGVGEPLGACLTRMMNDPKSSVHDRSRDLAILGDPTLRLHILAPAREFKALPSEGRVKLSWASPNPDACFFVYRSRSRLGPFKRISPEPVEAREFTDETPSDSERVYMVRALKRVEVPVGRYTNISQGVFTQVK